MKYLSTDPNILNGTTTIRETRIPISKIVNLLQHGYTIEEICNQYPQLNRDLVNHALNEAIQVLDKDLNASQTS